MNDELRLLCHLSRHIETARKKEIMTAENRKLIEGLPPCKLKAEALKALGQEKAHEIETATRDEIEEKYAPYLDDLDVLECYVVYRHFFLGKKYDDIAEEIHYSEAHIRKVSRLAVKKINERLSPNNIK